MVNDFLSEIVNYISNIFFKLIYNYIQFSVTQGVATL